jgi:hypothetical protein
MKESERCEFTALGGTTSFSPIKLSSRSRTLDPKRARE